MLSSQPYACNNIFKCRKFNVCLIMHDLIVSTLQLKPVLRQNLMLVSASGSSNR